MIGFLFLSIALAFSDYQSGIIRESIKKYGASDAVFIDVVMSQDYAHTDVARRIVSIDARRFDCCPKAFRSVVHHELDHTRGRNHCTRNPNGSAPPVFFGSPIPWCLTPDDPMGYVLTTDVQGNIVEDA